MSEAQRERRRLAVIGATLVAGTALLHTTIAVPSGSRAFGVVGLLLAATWTVGALVAGGLPEDARHPRRARRAASRAVVAGVLAFGAFVIAAFVARQIPVLDHALSALPARSDVSGLVLAVAVANAIGEELFFRGACYATVRGRHGPVLVTTALYAGVTVATLNAALVVAAVAMGTVFAVQRRSTRGVLVPITTHVTWSLLMLLALPR